MTTAYRLTTIYFVAMTIAAVPPAQVLSVTIDWVTVADPGNTADDTGFGAVANDFQIMKFEWTNSQYVEYLNAVDPNGTNPNNIYDSNMWSRAKRGGISLSFSRPAGSKYYLLTDMGDKPVNYINWFRAARVANWMHNGQGSGSTETGAYTLNNATSGAAPAANPNARFYIPTESQWYKAAYFKGGGDNAGYWEFATQAAYLDNPGAVTATASGDGSAGPTGNFVNYANAADWNGLDGNVTSVGTNGGASTYGTFDMSGNLFEWTDGTGLSSTIKPLRGGSFANGDTYSISRLRRLDFASLASPDVISQYYGFRLASPSAAAVPEPATCTLAVIGGALAPWLLRRRWFFSSGCKHANPLD